MEESRNIFSYPKLFMFETKNVQKTAELSALGVKSLQRRGRTLTQDALKEAFMGSLRMNTTLKLKKWR